MAPGSSAGRRVAGLAESSKRHLGAGMPTTGALALTDFALPCKSLPSDVLRHDRRLRSRRLLLRNCASYRPSPCQLRVPSPRGVCAFPAPFLRGPCVLHVLPNGVLSFPRDRVLDGLSSTASPLRLSASRGTLAWFHRLRWRKALLTREVTDRLRQVRTVA